ncbi:insulinase family protein [Clostridium sp. 19966]|uniref:M16 family metallopeptidase n=1 Tax=Clostridium sp. 19966 TaxID=2768166 RepID=UPI0028DEBD17|nr:pitrilysin family protein [Clostridium sp. 19966]MDT8716554.1 insulinase family protein [Clostridium sp. 19966]
MDYKHFDAKDTVLENGLRVVTIKKNTNIVSINCGIKIGAIDEEENEKGLAHFIEHMLFKGTKHRDNERLNEELELLGGDYNAYTDYTCTVYSITVLKEEFKKSVELLSDMIINSTFPKKEIVREREVVLAELSSSNDDIEDYSFKMINKIAYEKNPIKYDIIGERKSIKKFTQDFALKFYHRYYVPNNSVIVIASSMEHNDVLNIVKYNFSHWNYKEIQRKKCFLERNKSLKKISYKNNVEQSTITYLYNFYNLSKDEELALRVLNHRLGESANSILFRELREKRGLAYDVYTHLDTTHQIKTLYIYTAVKDKSIEEAINIIDDCINGITNGSIDINEKALILMKKVMKTAITLTVEDSADLSSYVLHQCLEEEDKFEFKQDMEKLEILNKQQIYDVAVKVLQNPTIHILKPRK